MAAALNWLRFKTGPISPDDAFEALAAQLFERWIARKLGSNVESYVLHGAGGDGGVEAFVTDANGDVLGLQAKWFPDNLDNSRVKQIRDSIGTARQNFPKLTHYIVAMPKNLTKGLRGKKGKPRKGGVERWGDLIKEMSAAYPNLEVIRWDEAGLLEQFAHPGGQGVKALWFSGELTFQKLDTVWRKTKARLNDRYLPSLHAVGQVDDIIEADRWTVTFVVSTRQTLKDAQVDLLTAISELEGFLHLTADNLPTELQAAIPPMLGAIASFRDHAAYLADATTVGPTSKIESCPSSAAVVQFGIALEGYKRDRRGAYAVEHAERALELTRARVPAIIEICDWIRSSAAPRIVEGSPGCGKTHGVAAATEDLIVQRGAPALMILAKDHDPGLGIVRIMTDLLDVPGWPLGRVLDGLEALALLDQIRRVKVDPDYVGFSRCLLFIDGLEESRSNSVRWEEAISELAVELESRRRVHLIALARPEYVHQITRPAGVNLTTLNETGNVDIPALFRVYANHFNVSFDQVPWIGWAMRNPLEVRLLAEEFQGRSVTAANGANANLLTLFRRKIRRLEDEARSRAGNQAWSADLDLVTTVLTELSELGTKTAQGRNSDTEIVHSVAALDPEFTAQRVRGVLSLLIEHGLVDRFYPPAQDLRAARPVYSLTTRHLSDFILAAGLARATVANIHNGKELIYPEILRQRHAAAILYAAGLAERDHFVCDLEWVNAPTNLRLLHAESLAYLPPATAGRRATEIQSWLAESLQLNRRLLARLIVRIARVSGHPLGPKLLDLALRSLPLATRDPIWSVPETLGGRAPWTGRFEPVLDEFRLSSEVDDWSSLPLVAAWTCSSVVETRRTRAREMLAQWGALRLGDMVHLLAHMADVDDPQIVDDLAVAALGAAIGAPTGEPALGDLAELVDRLFLGTAASVRTTSVPVRIAVRAIVERAAIVFPGRFDAELERSRPPYTAEGRWPALDLEELDSSAPNEMAGGDVVVGDLNWYVADRCFRKFSTPAQRLHHYEDNQVDPGLLEAVESGAIEGPEVLIDAQRASARARERASEPRLSKTKNQLMGLTRSRGFDRSSPRSAMRPKKRMIRAKRSANSPKNNSSSAQGSSARNSSTGFIDPTSLISSSTC